MSRLPSLASACAFLEIEIATTTDRKVKAIYRRLSKKLHPDVRGDEEDFKYLADCYEVVAKELARLGCWSGKVPGESVSPWSQPVAPASAEEPRSETPGGGEASAQQEGAGDDPPAIGSIFAVHALFLNGVSCPVHDHCHAMLVLYRGEIAIQVEIGGDGFSGPVARVGVDVSWKGSVGQYDRSVLGSSQHRGRTITVWFSPHAG